MILISDAAEEAATAVLPSTMKSRWVAGLVDYLALPVVGAVLLAAVGFGPDAVSVLGLLPVVVNVLVLPGVTGWSVGRRLVDARLVTLRSDSGEWVAPGVPLVALRLVLHVLDVLPLMQGFLLIPGWDPRNRTVADAVVGSLVLEGSSELGVARTWGLGRWSRLGLFAGLLVSVPPRDDAGVPESPGAAGGPVEPPPGPGDGGRGVQVSEPEPDVVADVEDAPTDSLQRPVDESPQDETDKRPRLRLVGSDPDSRL